jgi:hypothetical protein
MRITTTVILTCALAVAASASAQVAVSEPPPPAPTAQADPFTARPPRSIGQLRLGAFWVTPSLALREVGIDTNVLNSNSSAERNVDFTATGGPQADLLLVTKRVRLEGNGRFDYVYYWKNVGQRGTQLGGTMKTDFKASRRVLFSGQFSDLSTMQRFSAEVDVRARRRERSSAVSVEVGVAHKISVDLSGSSSQRRFDADAMFVDTALATTLNEDLQSARATARYAATPWTRLVVAGSASTHRFPLTSIKNADSREYTVGVEFKPRAILIGNLQIGYQQYVTLDQRVPDYEGPTILADLTYRLTDDTDIIGLYDRNVGLSYLPNVAFLLMKLSGAAVRRTLWSRADLTFEAYQQINDNLGFVPRSIFDSRPLDELTHLYISTLRVGVKRNARVGFHVMYSERLSGNLVRTYDGLRVWTSISYGRFSVRERNVPWQ